MTGGTIHAADAVAAQAQTELTTVYTSLANTPCNTDLTGQDLGGLTLTPGVYCFATSAQLTGTLTLDAQGNPNALFVFKIGSTLTTASTSSVLLINGGSDCGMLLAGRQLRDPGDRHLAAGKHRRADQHHPEHRRQRVGKNPGTTRVP